MKNNSPTALSIDNSPFVEDNISENDKKGQPLFLGLLKKRYIRTFHGLESTLALILGNYVFFERVVIGNSTSNIPSFLESTSTTLHICNLTASLITAIFLWNKVQSWQLSTTTMKEKGLTPKVLQRFNQGRGVVCMIMFSLFPTVLICPQRILEDRIFSTIFSLSLIAGSLFIYDLIKDYSKLLYVVYGLTPLALGISILTYGQGTVASFNDSYPLVSDRIQKEASFVISCVQMGFMLYYLYSRKLVTQHTVQKICRSYHVPMFVLYFCRVERDLWLQFSTDNYNGTIIPAPMLVQPMILTLAIFLKLLPFIVKKVIDVAKNATERSHKLKTTKMALIQEAATMNTMSSRSNKSKRRRNSGSVVRLSSICE